jgi:hypothetical protein
MWMIDGSKETHFTREPLYLVGLSKVDSFDGYWPSIRAIARIIDFPHASASGDAFEDETSAAQFP